MRTANRKWPWYITSLSGGGKKGSLCCHADGRLNFATRIPKTMCSWNFIVAVPIIDSVNSFAWSKWCLWLQIAIFQMSVAQYVMGFCLNDIVIPGFCSHCVVFLQWNIGRLSSHSERYIHGKDQNNDTRFIFIFSFIVFAQKRSFLKRHRTAKWAMPSLCLSFLSIPKKSYLFFFILSLLQPLLTITLQSHLPLLQWVVFKVNQPRVQLYW